LAKLIENWNKKINGGIIMKKLIVSLMLIISMFAFAAESAASATVGYVKYPCVAGDNFVGLPMQAEFGIASDFGIYTGEDGGTFTDGLVGAVNKFDSGTQKWSQAARMWAGYWDNDFAVTSGQAYLLNSTGAFNLIVNDEVVVNPAYNIVAGDNAVIVPLTKSSMTNASSYGIETGEDGGTFTDGYIGAVNKFDSGIQKWSQAARMWAGYWDNDFTIGIADPHLVNSSGVVVWPGAKIEGVPHVDQVAPAPKGGLKIITIGVKNHLVQEYVAATIPKVTYKCWLEQGAGAAITLLDTLRKGASAACVTKMMSYRGVMQVDLQEFDVWGMDNIVHILIRDENEAKGLWETTWDWTVNDVSTAPKLVGLDPLNAATGFALNVATLSSIEDSTLPSVTKLHQNYPNPFNPTTTIKFDLSSDSVVKLNVYNYNGQLVRSLVDGSMKAGFHTVNFDASNLSAGVYYYTMNAGNKTMTSKMVLVK
jgi:hypothetical protein